MSVDDKMATFVMEYVMERADKYYSDDFPITSLPDWIMEAFGEFKKEKNECDH